MFRNLSFSLSTLVLLLANPFWALAIDTIHFTNSDWTGIAAGTPFEVAWAGGDTSKPAKIDLVKGPAENLETVATLTEDSHSPYIWVPDQALVAGTYALSITQLSVTNYSPRFQVANAYNAGGSGGAGAGTGTGPAIGGSAPSPPPALSAVYAETGTGAVSQIFYSEAGAGVGAVASPTLTLTPIAVAIAAPAPFSTIAYGAVDAVGLGAGASASLSVSPAPAPATTAAIASTTAITPSPPSPSSSYYSSFTTTSSPSPSYPYTTSGIVKPGNGTAQGVATGIAKASDYKVVDFAGGAAGRGLSGANFGGMMVVVGAGVGILLCGGGLELGW